MTSVISDFIHKTFSNKNYCARCAKRYLEHTDKHQCLFCNKFFCSRHIAPEKHNFECSAIEKDYTQIKESENKYSVPYEKLNVEKFAKMEKSEKVAYLKKKQLEFKKYYIGNFCSYCDKKYNSWTDVHQCRYCDGYFCAMHWVPETHECKGNPLRPPGGMREVHHIGGRIDVHGK